ncbi:MAG: hypothetical protein HY422_02615 [Candidatus Komeilibacteria bacterium]|nr:hypothetical protein [Candidatus Komeilibacteria bacterium]
MKSKHTALTRAIERLDPHQVGLSTSLLPKQIAFVAKDFPKNAKLPPHKKWNSVVICAMGGSALGADLLRYVYEDFLNVRVTIVQGYRVPAFADRNTLVVLCSYSGTIEEIISCFKDARSRKLSSFVVASGGELMRLARHYRMPRYAFSTEFNPSKQPRIGTGYTMTALYMLFREARVLKPGTPDLLAAARTIPPEQGKALIAAQRLRAHSCIIIGAEHLRGNAHIISNQLNESAKAFAPYFFLSELNHHLLEGLGSLRTARRHWTVIFLDSSSYAPRMRRRVTVTRHVFEKQGFKTLTVPFAGSRIAQCLAALSYGSWLSYYLAILGGIRPSQIPWVDYFKKEL